MAKRYNCISSDAKYNMVSGDSGGRMNGSKSKNRIERQTNKVPENWRQNLVTEHPKWTQYSSRSNPSYGKTKTNGIGNDKSLN